MPFCPRRAAGSPIPAGADPWHRAADCVAALVDQVAFQLHPQQQPQIADVGGVREQRIVERVQLLQEDVAAVDERLRKANNALIDPWKCDRSNSAAEPPSSTRSSAARARRLPADARQLGIDEAFEEFQVAVTNPRPSRLPIAVTAAPYPWGLRGPVQQIATGIGGQGYGTGQDHTRFDLLYSSLET